MAPDLSVAVVGAHTLRSFLALFPEPREQIAFVHVTRWAAALPWTQLGAYRLNGEFNAALDPAWRVQVAADYMSAAGQNTRSSLASVRQLSGSRGLPAVDVSPGPL